MVYKHYDGRRTTIPYHAGEEIGHLICLEREDSVLITTTVSTFELFFAPILELKKDKRVSGIHLELEHEDQWHRYLRAKVYLNTDRVTIKGMPNTGFIKNLYPEGFPEEGIEVRNHLLLAYELLNRTGYGYSLGNGDDLWRYVEREGFDEINGYVEEYAPVFGFVGWFGYEVQFITKL